MRDTLDGKPAQMLQGEGFGPLLQLVLSKPLDDDPLAGKAPIPAAKQPDKLKPSDPPKGLPGMVVIPDSDNGDERVDQGKIALSEGFPGESEPTSGQQDALRRSGLQVLPPPQAPARPADRG